MTVQLPDGIAVHESAWVGVASKSGGKDFAKAKLLVAGPDGPESKEVRGFNRPAETETALLHDPGGFERW